MRNRQGAACTHEVLCARKQQWQKGPQTSCKLSSVDSCKWFNEASASTLLQDRAVANSLTDSQAGTSKTVGPEQDAVNQHIKNQDAADTI